MNFIQTPSPNYGDRAPGVAIKYIILHHTEMNSAKAALDWLCNPESEVSSHYLIEKSGVVHQLVADEHKAWHAGVSHWQGYDNLNDWSIGIELDNIGYQGGLEPFPEVQMVSLIELLQLLCKRYDIPRENVVGHADIAPNRKRDPSELFDWKLLHDQGFGLWPKGDVIEEIPENKTRWVQESLSKIGYKCPVNGRLDERTRQVISAFRLHFLPQNQTEEVDGKLLELLARMG